MEYRKRQGLGIARALGFDRLLCVCDSDNLASEAVILKNGGVLEDERYDAAEDVAVKRFRLPVSKRTKLFCKTLHTRR